MNFILTATTGAALALMPTVGFAADIEPNDFFSSANDLGTGPISFSGIIEANSPDTVSNDFFKWTSVSGGQFDVDLSFSNSISDIDLRLFNSDPGILAISATINDIEQVGFTAEAGDMFFIQVQNFGQPSPQNNYTLEISGPGTAASAVPLPAGLPLLLAGLGGLGLMAKRRPAKI